MQMAGKCRERQQKDFICSLKALAQVCSRRCVIFVVCDGTIISTGTHDHSEGGDLRFDFWFSGFYLGGRVLDRFVMGNQPRKICESDCPVQSRASRPGSGDRLPVLPYGCRDFCVCGVAIYENLYDLPLSNLARCPDASARPRQLVVSAAPAVEQSLQPPWLCVLQPFCTHSKRRRLFVMPWECGADASHISVRIIADEMVPGLSPQPRDVSPAKTGDFQPSV